MVTVTKQEILSTWDNASFRLMKQIPRLPGIYILSSFDDFLYVGTSQCIRTRITFTGDHPVHALLPFDSYNTSYKVRRQYLDRFYELKVYWLTFTPDDKPLRYKLESNLIKRFSPCLNNLQSRHEFVLWMNDELPACTRKILEWKIERERQKQTA